MVENNPASTHGLKTRGSVEEEGLRRIKAEYLKKKADGALRSGNLREAYTKYSECLEVVPDKQDLDKIYSNRSLAYFKALKYEAALSDADQAIALNPMFAKAHWRRGVALYSLHRFPEALRTFKAGWALDRSSREFERELWRCVERHTREQLAEGIIEILKDMLERKLVHPPKLETVSEAEMVEALFKHIFSYHQDRPSPGDYYKYYHRYVKEGMSVGAAYSERSAMYAAAKCYLQAKADAESSIEFWTSLRSASTSTSTSTSTEDKNGNGGGGGEESEGSTQSSSDPLAEHRLPRCLIHRPGTTRPFKWLDLNPLGLAYFRLGEACEAEHDHPHQSWIQATKAYTRAVDLDHEMTEYQSRLSDAGSRLSNAQMSQVLNEVYNEAGSSLVSPLALGITDTVDGDAALWRCEGKISFPEAKAKDFGAKARDCFRDAVSFVSGVPKLKVMIERVRPPNMVAKEGLPPALEIHFQVQFGSDRVSAERLRTTFTSSPGKVVAGDELKDRWGMGEIDCTQQGTNMEVVDVTPLIQKQRTEDNQVPGENGGDLQGRLNEGNKTPPNGELDNNPASSSDDDEDDDEAWLIGVTAGDEKKAEREEGKELAVPARPKLDLELPYRSYRLVYTGGQPVERVDKHPFCMSRVHYHSKDVPKQVWAEMSDGSCAWRQSADEITVMCLKVPCGLKKRDIVVCIEMRRVHISHRTLGVVYLEGELHREIVPEDSMWTLEDGQRDEGFVLHLKKMNLELYQKWWQHNRMWWSQLFSHHCPIVWDDYDKDYSDLPSPILEEHFRAEGERDQSSRLEQREKKERETLQERNDLRLRKRQERLNQLRGNKMIDWVTLNRMRPTKDDLVSSVPAGRDRVGQ